MIKLANVCVVIVVFVVTTLAAEFPVAVVVAAVSVTVAAAAKTLDTASPFVVSFDYTGISIPFGSVFGALLFALSAGRLQPIFQLT